MLKFYFYRRAVLIIVLLIVNIYIFGSVVQKYLTPGIVGDILRYRGENITSILEGAAVSCINYEKFKELLLSNGFKEVQLYKKYDDPLCHEYKSFVLKVHSWFGLFSPFDSKIVVHVCIKRDFSYSVYGKKINYF